MRLLYISIIAAGLLLFMTASGLCDLALPHLGSWGSKGSQDGEFLSPTGIALDKDGNVYVADQRNNRVQKFSPGGHFITKWGNGGPADLRFQFPTGVAVSADGEVFVTDQGHHRVMVFDASGTYRRSWGPEGPAPGRLLNPTDIAVSPNGVVYVADTGNSRVALFSTNGELLGSWGPQLDFGGTLVEPIGLCASRTGEVYVIDDETNNLYRFDGAGKITSMWKLDEERDLKIHHVMDVAVVSEGGIVLLDAGKGGGFLSVPKPGRLIIMNPNGEVVKEVGGSGSGSSPFEQPRSLATDGESRIFVADSGNNRVHAFGLPTQFASIETKQIELQTVPYGDRTFGLTAGAGNSFGGIGLAQEFYLVHTRVSFVLGLGFYPNPNRNDFEDGEISISAGVRGFTKGNKHRGYVQFSVQPLEYYYDHVEYGPSLVAGYHYIARGGFTFLADLGVGLNMSSEEAVPVSSIGFGYSWRK